MPWDATLSYTTRLTELQVVEFGERKSILRHVRTYFVNVSRGDSLLQFRVHRRGKSMTLRDLREEATGSDGTQGLWGTRQPKKNGTSRSLTPTAWKAEVSRLIGSDRADEIIRQLIAITEEQQAKNELVQRS